MQARTVHGEKLQFRSALHLVPGIGDADHKDPIPGDLEEMEYGKINHGHRMPILIMG
jgi:hypothetical protein